MILIPVVSAVCVLAATGSLAADEVGSRQAGVHHDLDVTLHPDEKRLSVRDTVTLKSGGRRDVVFALHAGLSPSSQSPGVTITQVTSRQLPLPQELYRVGLPPGTTNFVVEYSGVISHPLDSPTAEQARGFRSTPGLISVEGVYLEGDSVWYPRFDVPLLSFVVTVSLPPGWDAVSQGERTRHERRPDATVVRWESPEPQDEIHLVAARFVEYGDRAGHVQAMAFLRSPDEGLAKKYLEATGRYLPMYEELIGPYPYKKFALVENFWETGFGMPSFTLLGPKVIRLPFIIDSSYPHEILHNWWGNGVFPVYERGNWSEGLTAYLSDHLIKDQQGGGAEYREAVLQKYADYVLKGRDFALTEFRSRHSAPSEAVGYGKSLMFFHMLRMGLGDETFIAGLRHFYRAHRFGFADFDDLRKNFEEVSRRDLNREFTQWVSGLGSPKLVIRGAEVAKDGDGYVLTARLAQLQPGEHYLLRAPLAVTMEGHHAAYQTTVTLDKAEAEVQIVLPHRPLRVDIDPEFDLFRRLDRGEIPPAVSQALGAEEMLILIPSSAPAALRESYRALAESLRKSGQAVTAVKLDTEVDAIPSDRAVAVLGWENRFANESLSVLTAHGVKVTKTMVEVQKKEIPLTHHTVVLTAGNTRNKDAALMFIASDAAEALPGLARKLPHYHKYSYLVFEGNEPVNVAKGRWPVVDSPMTVYLPGGDGTVKKVERARLAPRSPLARLPQPFSHESMMETVRYLSSDELAGRGVGSQGLLRAGEYIAGKFRDYGLSPGGDDEGSYFQQWDERFDEDQGTVPLRNVIGVIPGRKPDFGGQSVVVAAHYDHLGLGWPDVREGNRGKVHPGADDNASGVAVLLELARVLAERLSPDRTIVFVAFTAEEAGRKGSSRYVTHYGRYPAERAIGMVNLDTVGRLGKNKVLFLGADSATEWVHILRGAGFVAGVEVEAVSQELDASDQVSFHRAGVPAVQITTGPHLDYHRPGDTDDKIDASGLVKIASLAREAIEYLAKREGPLTATWKEGGDTEPTSSRKVSLGTIPDFAFSGPGVRLSGVVPGSPAETSGLREGDVLVEVNGVKLVRLKDLSEVLKSLNPGMRVTIGFLREGKQMTTETDVTGR